MCSMFHLCVAVSVLYCLYKITGGKRALVNQLVIASCVNLKQPCQKCPELCWPRAYYIHFLAMVVEEDDTLGTGGCLHENRRTHNSTRIQCECARASGTQKLRTKKELSELTRRWHTWSHSRRLRTGCPRAWSWNWGRCRWGTWPEPAACRSNPRQNKFFAVRGVADCTINTGLKQKNYLAVWTKFLPFTLEKCFLKFKLKIVI